MEPVESSKPADVDDSDCKKDWITIVIAEMRTISKVHAGDNGKSHFHGAENQ